jgi:ABC-2 type transport system permease protein
MRRYLEIYGIMLRNSLIREMSFKVNFLLWMFVELLWFAGQIAFLEVLFQYVDDIAGWTKWEAVLLMGTHQVVGQVFQAFFYTNVANVPELVRTGRMDFMLLLPVDSQFAVSLKQFSLDSLLSGVLGLVFVGFALGKLHVTPAPHQVAGYLIAVAFGVAIHYAVMMALATVSFWIVKAQGLIFGYYNIFNLARYPDTVFQGFARFMFSWVLPVVVVTNIPARLLLHAIENPVMLLLRLFLPAVLVLAGARLFWFAALRRYSSASS